MSEVTHDPLQNVFRVNSIGMLRALIRHVFHSKDVKVLVLIAKDLGEGVFESFCGGVDWSICHVECAVVRSQVDNGTLLVFTILHVRPKEPSHKDHGISIYS